MHCFTISTSVYNFKSLSVQILLGFTDWISWSFQTHYVVFNSCSSTGRGLPVYVVVILAVGGLLMFLNPLSCFLLAKWKRGQSLKGKWQSNSSACHCLLCAVRQHVLDWSTRTRQHAAQKGWTVWILIWLLTFKSISLFSSYLARCFLSHLHHPAISPFPGSCHFLPSSLPLSRPFPFRPLSFSLSLTPSVFFQKLPSNCQVSCLSPLISRSLFSFPLFMNLSSSPLAFNLKGPFYQFIKATVTTQFVGRN